MYLPYVVCMLVAASVVYSDVLKECQKFECPEYEVVEKKENYEIRKYPAYKAAVVRTKGLSFIKARSKNFFKLYRYQQGGNDKHHSFPMVYPFVTLFTVKKWKSGDEEKEEVLDKDFKMAYFIPKALHDDPPKPVHEKDEVVLAESPARTLYAVSFPGHATSWKVKELQQKLKASLIADGVDFDHSSFGVMEYNKWNELWGRHNDLVYSSKV